jgi:predicted negative regulator of RcsB-dependent stress response
LFIMELQDAPAAYFFKLWPKIEANWIRIALGGGVIIVVAVLISFYSWQRDQKEINAGKALTQFMMSAPHNVTVSQQADNILKIAGDYQGTIAGQRAWLQGAAMLFAAGRYADAQTQFQKFLDAHPDSFFAAQAALGVATGLDAQGKTDLAAGAYQRVINISSDVMVANSAKFALAQIDERQGKLADAMNLYEEVMRSNPNGSLGSEAGLRAMELKMKLSSAPPSTAPAAPVSPNH